MAHYCELLGPSLRNGYRCGSVARSSGFALCSFDADAILSHDPGNYLSQVFLGIGGVLAVFLLEVYWIIPKWEARHRRVS